jgi:hypothetical protein
VNNCVYDCFTEYRQGDNQQLLGGAVTVPTSLFKVLYTPDNGISAFIADNSSDAEVIQIDLQQLEEITGIRFFPHNSNSSVLPDQTWDIPYPTKNLFEKPAVGHDVPLLKSLPAESPQLGGGVSACHHRDL